MNLDSRLSQEAAAAPGVVRAQLRANRDAIGELGRALRDYAPRAVVTCARGSSDHAATYARYLIETRTGLLASSAAPSVSSLYDAKADLRSVLFVAISQSGASPDLLAAVEAAKTAGALVVALVNDEDSPLARASSHTIPLRAGAEESVAATKSYIASLSAIVQLIGSWTRDDGLLEALDGVPDQLERAWQLDWSAAIEPLRDATSLFVVGRGLGLGVAQEAALKLKEACGLHAEAFSSAELRHGPVALVGRGFPVLAFTQGDETRADVESLARELAGLGARVLLAGSQTPGAVTLPAIRAHPAIEPLLLIQSFYRFANTLALARGRDPDRPPHLRKVTETV
ncbi:MAG TPA: SIS domain-containing protein [Steroidobacteraceae bacterium]|nr:SIS domain-containing protein [Steroidobacteraceae bacterium]